MKKLLCALLICALCACALSGCRRRTSTAGTGDAAGNAAPEVTPVPEEGSHGEVDQSQALADMPTLVPVEKADGGDATDDDDDADDEDYYSMDAVINPVEEPEDAADGEVPASEAPTMPPGGNVIDPTTMQFSSMTNEEMRFGFSYPSDWINVPGVYTVCYREMVEPGDFPARVAISGKLLVHSPEGTVITDELTEFTRVIRKQYDDKTFQLGTINSEDTFIGRKAFSNTYLAYSGSTEVKGFIIGTSVGRVLFVFHFCASYEDYAALERVMRFMANSVFVLEENN